MSRAAVALFAVVCGALVACRGPSDRVTVRLWAMGREAELLDELVAAFEREHPGVHVDVQQQPWTAAHEKLLTAFVGDATPDVAQLGNTWLPELAALGALAPLDGEVAGSPVVRPADYFSGIWETNVVDGVLYGVPWYVDTRIVFYRRDLFAAAGFATHPTSWAGWLEALRAIKAQVGPARYGVLLPLDEYDQLIALALQGDDELLRDGGRWGNFRGAGFRQALTLYLTMFVEQLAPVATQVQVSNPWDELARGYFACFLHGPWSLGEFARRLPASQQHLWETAPLPGPRGPGASSAGGASLVVFRRSAHRREAWQLIEFLSRPDVQRRFRALSGDLPPRRESWDDPSLAGDLHVAAFRDQLERVRRAPPVPEWERISGELRVVSERAARQVSPSTPPAELAAIVDAAAADLDHRVDEMLDKRRWVLARAAAGARP